jgi:ABC-type glucose/galactose transport system permease subunit
MPHWLLALPVVARCAVAGALLAGIVGSVTGVVVGLVVYAPTAWFALVELGLPSTMAGAILGLITGSVIVAFRHARA